jgi:hypothetical protein
VLDLRSQHAERLLHVFTGLHVLGSAPPGRRQAVEQVGVDVVPHAEGEHAGAPATLLGLSRDALGVLLAHGGQPIGQEHHDGQACLGAVEPEGLVQRSGDVGAAVGVEPVDPGVRVAQLRAGRLRPRGAVGGHAVAERQQPEAVLAIQRAQQLAQRRLRLLDLAARHGARHVEHDGQVAGQAGAVRTAGRERQHEVAVLAGRLVGDERDPHQPPGHGEEHDEVPAQFVLGPHGEPSALAGHVQRVCGGERVPVGTTAVGHQRERERGVFGARLRHRGVLAADPPAEAATGGVAELQGVAGPLHDLGVAQRDLACLPGVDGEHAGPHETVPGQLDQRRIALAADDLLIDRPCLGGVHRLPPQLQVALEQGEVAEHCLAGERIEVVALPEPTAVRTLMTPNAGSVPGTGSIHPCASRGEASKLATRAAVNVFILASQMCPTPGDDRDPGVCTGAWVAGEAGATDT